MISGNLLSADELEAKRALAKAIRSGEVDWRDIEAEEDYIPPSQRKRWATPVGPISE